MTSYLHGKSYTRQTVANIRLRQFADNHPCSYGWQVLRVHKEHQLPVYHKDGVELMRHPDSSCWLLQYLSTCYRSECHISQISTELETIKLKIELELSKQEFSAAVEKLAA
jgi:hypothetical protein